MDCKKYTGIVYAFKSSMGHFLQKTVAFWALIWTLCLFFCSTTGFTQQRYNPNYPLTSVISKKDTIKKNGWLDSITSKRFIQQQLQRFLGKSDTGDATLQESSHKPYLPFEGKVIRQIVLLKVSVFGTEIDTVKNFPDRVKNFFEPLHVSTRDFVINQALFFKKNDKLNAYEMADNERYIRDLPFIHDARILVDLTESCSDSVDVLVATRDIFGPGLGLKINRPDDMGISIYDLNLGGWGQRLQFGVQWNTRRDPVWGTSAAYQKSNILGTLINTTVGYSQLNDQGQIDTGVYESSYFINLNRPLYSPRSHFTGGLFWNYNRSLNVNSITQEYFRDYDYRAFNVWGAWAFTPRDLSSDQNPTRKALAAKYYQRNFINTPSQPQFAFDPNYNDWKYNLYQFILYKQQYYKGRYIFGFGRTEDVPYGFTLTFTGGVEERLNRSRLYEATEFEKIKVFRKGNFFTSYIGIGGFINKGWEDGVISARFDYYSTLLKLGKFRLRQISGISYIDCVDPAVYKPININNENGLVGFYSYLLNNYQRFNIRTESSIITPYSLLDFKINFWALIQLSQIGPNDEFILAKRIYTVLGAGIRIRNENLAFRTLRLGVYYYPMAPSDVKKINFEIGTEIPFRFRSSAIREPSFVGFR